MARPPEQGGEGPDDLTVDEIRAALRGAAQAYEPSRPAMERRIAAARRPKAGYARRAFFTMRPVGAALAVAVISVLSVVAVRSTANDELTATVPPPAAARVTARPSTVEPSAVEPPATSASPSASAGRSSPSRATASAPAGRTGPARPTGGTAGFLSAAGSVGPTSDASFAEHDVTVTTTKTVSALRVTITVTRTADLSGAQQFTTAPNNDIIRTVGASATTLTFSYVLRRGGTLAPGRYVFAAQFHHDAGRDAKRDAYTLDAATGSARTTRNGAFSQPGPRPR